MDMSMKSSLAERQQSEASSEYDDSASHSSSSPSVSIPLSVHHIATQDKSHFLPPCKVCSGNATGFHYGANTCEACKAFFRRYTGHESNLKPCKRQGRCTETAKKGKISCAMCRYARCVLVGMTKEGIKKGRYTYEKRFRDAVELRQMQALERREKMLNPKFSETCLDTLVESFKMSFPELYYVINNHKVVENRLIQAKVHLHQTVGPLDSTPILLSPGIKTNEEEALFYDYLKSLSDRIGEGGGEDKMSAFGTSDTIKMIWLGLSTQFESQLASVVKFAKLIPGFSELETADQMTLLKAAHTEILVLLRCRAVLADWEGLVRYYPETEELRLIPLSMITPRLLSEDFCEFHDKLTYRVMRLNMGVEILSALLTAIIISPDRDGLVNKGSVEKLQKTLLPVLQYTMSENYADFSKTCLADALLLLPMLRESGELYFNNPSLANQQKEVDHVNQSPVEEQMV